MDMKADLSRGHHPDRQRGKSYRRVLLQQGRLLLDSDLAAFTDAIDAQMRGLARVTVGKAGGWDHGFLVTPGMPLAIFDSLDMVTRGADSSPELDYYIDHGVRYPDIDPTDAQYRHLDLDLEYLGRLPSLHINAVKGAGSVTVALLNGIDGNETIRIWARIPVSTQLSVTCGGAPRTVHGRGADTFQPYDVVVPAGISGCRSITVAISAASANASRVAWLGLVERREPAGNAPSFWVKKGWYSLGGLALELAEDGSFPGVSFPNITGARFSHADPSASGLFVAYLEGWERLVTHVEDPGLIEQALGGTTDTCARSQAIGQIKVAAVPGGLHAARIPSLFDQVKSGKGTLAVTAQAQAALRQPYGHSHAQEHVVGENRLYRFEVHRGGSFDDFEIKWSRNNGAEVFQATKTQAQAALAVPLGADLRDGDLVELLSARIDLDDTAAGQLDASGFLPPRRAVGQLYFVRELPETPGQIQLVGSNGVAVNVGSDPVFDQPGLKLRKWHGVLRAQAGTPAGNVRTYVVDGLEIAIGRPSGNSGNATLFCPGDYWQYQARAVQANDNGTWNPLPHGPERIFTPLALLRRTAPDQPLEILQWYSRHVAPLGELDADHVAYDSAKVRSSSRTVQQALDELFTRRDDGGTSESVRITQITPLNDPTGNLQNDASITASAISPGLRLQCSRRVDATTLTQATCYVILELPYPFTADERAYWGQAVVGFQPVKLDGEVSTMQGATPDEHWIIWKPANPSVTSFLQVGLLQKMSLDNRGTRVLARLILHGNFIRAHEDPVSSLDGDTFGITTAGGNLHAALPSGDGRRGGNFEMWFWLVPDPVRLKSLTISPEAVTGTVHATGTITLTGRAPSGGLVIGISSDQAAATVPVEISISGGNDLGTFQITTSAVERETVTTIMARLTGSDPRAAHLSILPPKLVQITLSDTLVTSGTRVTGTVSLDYPAPAAGVSVSLQVEGSGVKSIPSSVLIQAGYKAVDFSMDTEWNGGSPATPSITATLDGVTRSASLVIQPTMPVVQSLTLDADNVVGGNPLSGRVRLSKRAFENTTLSLNSSNHQAVTPDSVTIQSDQEEAPFVLGTSPVVGNTPVIISAGGVTNTATVLAPTLSALALPGTLESQDQGTGTVTLSGKAAAQTWISLESNTALVTVPQSIPVAPGESQASFAVTAQRFTGNDVTARIRATLGNQTREANVTVKAEADAVPVEITFDPVHRAGGIAKVTGGTTLRGTVALDKPAFAPGKSVTLGSTHEAVTSDSITIPTNMQRGSFELGTSPVTENTLVTISAGGVGNRVMVSAAILSRLDFPMEPLGPGGSATGTIFLTGPAAVDIWVTLESTDQEVATVESPVMVRANEAQAAFAVQGMEFYDGQQRQASIRGSYGGTAECLVRVLSVWPDRRRPDDPTRNEP
jgi:hypothetical protein